MNNFTYYNPVKLIFGENTLLKITNEIPKEAKILVVYGGGSIKKNGIFDQVVTALQGYRIIEYGGIEANPQYQTLMGAVELCRKEGVDFILSVGGGSVLDGTKFIAAAAKFGGEPWDIPAKQAKVKSALPFGAVLTLPATGSEMNAFAVISRKETGQKLAFGAPPLTYPKFSILDPAFTRSLPVKQRANGVVDAFVHVTEQYLTYPQNTPLQDRFAESILKTLIEEGPKYLQNPHDMDAAKNVMWAATMALNGILSAGVITDWATHSIGHELTALHQIDHARTLAIVWPGMMRTLRDEKREKLLQFAKRIWDISSENEDDNIETAIRKTEEFFNSIGVETKLNDYGLDHSVIEKVINNLKANNYVALGERKMVTPEKVKAILADRV
jgi:NADP-dependent alcohol dehydrogenase